MPVGAFRTTTTSVAASDVDAALHGGGRYEALELVSADADAILAALGSGRPADGKRLVLAPNADSLAADLAAHRSRLGFLRASQVGPSVRALGWNGKSLFGTSRVRSVADWPLSAHVASATAADAFNPAQTWTIVAAGDVMLDRGVYKQVKLQGKGIDFPFDGGRASITGRYCCSSFDWVLPRTQRNGGAGAVRSLFRGADISMANLEGPAPVHSTYHTEGTMFSFDQSLLRGLSNAGIDWVSLANNHIGNAGRTGIVETVAALERLGIAHSGAGANTAAATKPATFTVQGVRVAVLGYDSIAPGYIAGPSKPGAAELSAGTYASDIRAARAAGASLVIVYPHWGVEYRATPTAAERNWAHQMIDAGADLVIGNHAHWAAGMEVYKGKPIWYALGNFVFDQTWSEETEEGLILELTFRGSTLVQAWLHPTILLDASQANFLDATSGKIVMDRVYKGSKGLLPW